jgi:hypothetical protein
MPAMTLGGTVTGTGQNVSGLGAVTADSIKQVSGAGLFIGLAGTDKLGFYGAATVTQPTHAADLVATVVGDFAGGNPTSAEAVVRLNLIEAKINAMIAKLEALGLFAAA